MNIKGLTQDEDPAFLGPKHCREGVEETREKETPVYVCV